MRNKIQTHLSKYGRRDLTMQVSPIAKFMTLLVPFTHSNTQLMHALAFVNIMEAVTVDIIYKCYVNVMLGVALACSSFLVESLFIFKMWCVFYFAWNVCFCQNRGWRVESAIGNNLPSLYVALTCKSGDIAICLDKWGTCRVASTLTQTIANARLGNL